MALWNLKGVGTDDQRTFMPNFTYIFRELTSAIEKHLRCRKTSRRRGYTRGRRSLLEKEHLEAIAAFIAQSEPPVSSLRQIKEYLMKKFGNERLSYPIVF